ncbi:Homogentisate 1,2-dioxygenase [Hyaloraphidium curvatum]|nr:Homogentisate 1,2-dioxygenase [Hyaloraphidium curvatum]
MGDRCFYNSDGSLLIVPQHGTVLVRTEFGKMSLAPNEIAVVQRGIRFSVDAMPGSPNPEGFCRGYVFEVFGGNWELPELGPLGANGLANPRDFLSVTAWFEDRACPAGFEVVAKYAGKLWTSKLRHSPFDVVAWHGNLAPYKYDLRRFCAVNTVTFDHMDPSVYTVLTARSATPGLAVADFTFFPPRWDVASGTFRPPFYHRNAVTEYVGIVKGPAAAAGGGVSRGPMTSHGLPMEGYEEGAFRVDGDVPARAGDGDDCVILLESLYPFSYTEWAMRAGEKVDGVHEKNWTTLKKYYTGPAEGSASKL